MSDTPDTITLHRVPEGATIPSGTRYIYHYGSSISLRAFGVNTPNEDYTPASAVVCYTLDRIEAPKPELPTETGAFIYNVTNTHGATCDVMVRNVFGYFIGGNVSGVVVIWDGSRIASFSLDNPSEAKPAVNTDLWNEDDKRKRRDEYGDVWGWDAASRQWGYYLSGSGPLRSSGQPTLEGVLENFAYGDRDYFVEFVEEDN